MHDLNKVHPCKSVVIERTEIVQRKKERVHIKHRSRNSFRSDLSLIGICRSDGRAARVGGRSRPTVTDDVRRSRRSSVWIDTVDLRSTSIRAVTTEHTVVLIVRSGT